MRITKELLEKYHAHGEDMEKFCKMFPGGADSFELMRNKWFSDAAYHWAYEHLPCTEEDIIAYHKMLGVENSSNIYYSREIVNSSNVVNSRNVKDSIFVQFSENVENSYYINNSMLVKNSKYVEKSNFIEDCSLVLDSQNMTNSRCIAHCNFVEKSFNMTNCHTCDTSFLLSNSKFSTNCGFSNYLVSCDSCLFCYNLSNAKYYIFNKETTEQTFNMVKNTIKKILNGETILPQIVITSGDNEYLTMREEKNPSIFFSYINTRFYDWIKTLPQFDPIIMQNITYDSRWLRYGKTN